MINVENINETRISSTDKIIYRVILDLAEVGKTQVIHDRMRDANLFCVSIANSHPHLILRFGLNHKLLEQALKNKNDASKNLSMKIKNKLNFTL